MTAGNFADANALKMSGDETISQVLDRLSLNRKEIYGDTITLMTTHGTYTGKMVDKGNNFVVMEIDNQRQTMGKGESKKVMSQVLVLSSTITGFRYDFLR